MTTVAVYPFYGRQNKETGRFLVRSSGTSKIAGWLARQMVDDLGWKARMLLPLEELCEDEPFYSLDGVDAVRVRVPASNAEQRLHWSPRDWGELVDGCDGLLSVHETIAWPIRCLHPRLRIAQITEVPPGEAFAQMDALYPLAWRAADLNAVPSRAFADLVERETTAGGAFAWQMPTLRPRVWPLAYDERLFAAGDAEHAATERDIDVLFLPRASSTNYTRHLQFVEACRRLRARGSKLSVWFTDVTRYLRRSGEADGIGARFAPEPDSQDAYRALLRRSKVVVALRSNLYSMPVREAIRSGAFPVLASDPGYFDLVGADWLWAVDADDPGDIADGIQRAFADGLWGSSLARAVRPAVDAAVARESFQSAWSRAVRGELRQVMEGAR